MKFTPRPRLGFYGKAARITPCAFMLLWGIFICLNGTAPGAQNQTSVGALFVSTQGSDDWSGTLPNPNANRTDGPLATLDRALDVRRESANRSQGSPNIVIRKGTYPVTKTVELHAGDSGSAGHPFTISAYPGEHPVLDGGIKLPGTWRKQDGGALWSLQLSGSCLPVEDLFLNGKRLPRSRMPSTGCWRTVPAGEGGDRISFPAGAIKAMPDAANGICVIKTDQWFEEMLPIRAIDLKDQTITLARKMTFPFAGSYDPHAGEFFIENLRAGVDGPGKWCFDPVKKILLFWPPDGLDPNHAEIVAGGIPLLMSVTGDAAGGHMAEHVVLDGLTFLHSGRYPAIPYVRGAALLLSNGVRNCVVRHCRFTDLGGDGIMLSLGCHDCLIEDNEFAGDGGAAVRIFDYLGEAMPVSSGNRIENNVIHHCGVIIRHSAGIELENTSGNRIAHNLIFDLPYDGIVLNGDRPDGWPPEASPGLKPPYTSVSIKPYIPTRGNIIEWNHVHHVMQELADGGGIYLWGVMGGKNYIRHNLVEHVGSGSGDYEGIYLDDDCDDVEVTENVACDATRGLLLHGASRNLILNNIFAWSRESDIYVQPEKYNVFPMDAVLKNNIYYQCTGPVFKDTSWAAWDRHPLKDSDANLYWQNGAPVYVGEGNFKGFDSHSLVADPQFRDPTHGDFRLAPGSPALQLGIHSFDIRNAGPEAL